MSFLHPWPALEKAAELWPDAEALVFPHQNERRSFLQWRNDALALAGQLAAHGLRRGDHIALLAENRVEWPIVQMACAALGALFIPLNTHYRRDDLAFALKQSRARAIFCSARYRSNPFLATIAALRPELPELDHVFCLDGEGAMSGEAHLPSFAGSGDDIGALLYTSGTTGFPKGALLSHRAMMMVADGTASRLGLAAGDRWTSIIPLFHCAGCIMNILGCLQHGAAYVGVPSFDAEAMFKIIETERCTHLSGVPTSYLAMLDHPARHGYDLGTLRAGSCGGADCDPTLLRRCAAEFPMPGLTQVYGQTEGATIFTAPRHDDPRRWETAGTALPGYEIRIVEPQTLHPRAVGEIGEIQARGPMVMAGYHDRPQETAEVLLSDGWLRTGDLGYLDHDGHLVIAGGRLRDMIIRGGENIYPAEIENVLCRHAMVKAAAVFAESDRYYGEIVAAAVRLDGAATAADLKAHCAARIAHFKVPARLYAVETFPLTPSGKVRKVELRRLAAEGKLAALS